MTMSDRIAVMNKGRFEQVGDPQDVYELPATEFVASFLGASNLLTGEVDGVEGEVAAVALAAGGTVVLPAQRLPTRRGTVAIGVRPEKIEIKPATAAAGNGANSIEATVMISTYTGVSTSYQCTTGDGSSVTVYVQNLGTDVEALGAGARVRLTWDPEHTFAVEKSQPPDSGPAEMEEQT